jgi:uncharacterized protein YabE (DUF348 family)/3D (Asp-Asp-Asp) domain-containing protein
MPRWLRGFLALGLVVGVLFLLGLGLSRTGSPLVVVIDGQRHEVRTHAATVGAALRRAGFELYPEDRVSPGLGAPLQPGEIVEVQCARPVNLQVDGQTRQVRTHATTVGQLLAEARVKLGPADQILLGERLVELETLLWGGETPTSRTVSYRGGGRTEAQGGSMDSPPVVTLRRATAVTLDDNGTTRTLHTTLDTVGQLLAEHGVTLFLGDEVQPALQDRVSPGMPVTIQRSVPVQIAVDGRTIRTRTRAESVAGLLGQENIALIGRDRVEPALSEPVHPELTVQVVRVREDVVVEFEPIPFETEWVPDPEVEIDKIRLVRDGQLGLTKRRFRIVYEDDREIERTLEDVWTEQSPITKTMAYGTKIVIRTMDTPDGPIEYWRKMRVYLTSYMPKSCGKPPDHPRYGYTRLGLKLRRGIVATDPTVIPLRTKLYVPGYGLSMAGDTGSGVKGKFVDLGFTDDDYESWHWWGEVYLLTPVPPADKIRWILPNWPKFPDRKRR